jgi:hypothetical protein
MIFRRLLLVLACVALPLACGEDEGTDDGGSETTAVDDSDDTTPEGAELSSYENLEALVDALTDAGYDCALEYEGLEDDGRTVSLCTLVPPESDAGSQATLNIWEDPARVAALASSTATELTVYGDNWTIDTREAATAAAVADVLGGETGTN